MNNAIINMVAKKYTVIYADPPWTYKNKKTGRGGRSGASQQYPVMTVEEIKKLAIPTDKNAVLFLWITVPLLPEGLDVLKAWGFKYKTTLTWRKVNSLGLGFWFRGQCEYLLFGVKGSVKAFRMQESNFIQSKVGRHSEKPLEFREKIERATINMPAKLELFARAKHEGWDSWGNEVKNDIIITSVI